MFARNLADPQESNLHQTKFLTTLVKPKWWSRRELNSRKSHCQRNRQTHWRPQCRIHNYRNISFHPVGCVDTPCVPASSINWWRELESNQLRNIAVNIPAEYIRRHAGIPSVNLVSARELNPTRTLPSRRLSKKGVS